MLSEFDFAKKVSERRGSGNLQQPPVSFAGLEEIFSDGERYVLAFLRCTSRKMIWQPLWPFFSVSLEIDGKDGTCCVIPDDGVGMKSNCPETAEITSGVLA